MDINFKTIGQGEPLIIMHGLFGMLDNWQSIAKLLSNDFQVITIDLPNHGKSSHSDKLSYENMAYELYEFMNLQGLLNAHILGHSMGGKVAMQFAQHYSDYVKKLIVIDIGPKYYPIHHHEILEALNSINFKQVKSRTQVQETLTSKLGDSNVAAFLSKSLYWRQKNELEFRFNLPVLSNQIEEVGKATEDRIFNKPTLFIRGGLSDYVKDEDIENIHTFFPAAKVKTIFDAGHWVHAQKPKELTSMVHSFLL